ncbi:disease resistance protein RPS5 [Eucalyptus grandis]|uniref:disease resistance protein RPS5 n=1 Tax=Eucalyptus grandis TaxID=71139 RepID=UPI00192F0A67|nr:disease resistance protein RPS5 [Eucalyptus grandis]
MSGDVKGTVEREEREGGVRRTNQVENWLCKVQEFEGGVDQVLEEARECDRIKCFSRCLPQNCWSSYKLGKRVDRLLNEARELQGKKREFSNFTSPLPSPAILAIPMVKTVGLNILLNEVWKWLADEKKTGMFGLYGMGGVGKTTLMKHINNELLCTNLKFDVVIWVVVSKQVNEDNIRDVVRKGLNIKDEIWDGWSQNHRVHHLLNSLAEKKFVLLIDDVWARLDLFEIGVLPPSPKNGSKVVFTTRSKQVCHQMGANETCEVSCLKPEEALTLFEKNIGKSLENCDDDIQRLAKDIAKECKGLPLALVTVGRAMAGREHPHEWHYALTTLRNKPHQLSGMEEVYHILEFSYNSLSDSIVKFCFLYCCLFPEDYLIDSHDLIELWIGEGLLGDTDDVYNMRESGEYVLGSLKMACLLESETVIHLGLQFVKIKMHDVIRDMATWIARDHGKKENKLLVIEKEEDMSTKGMSKWGEAEKVSLWGKWISNIHQAPLGCFQPKTLIVRETKVSVLPRGFFESMAACLMVLDLSNNNNIDVIPEGICNLISLRWELSLENEEEVVEELGRMQGLTDLSIKVNKSSSALKIFQSFQRCIRRVGIENCEGLTHIPISHSLKGSGNFSHLEVLSLEDCPMLVKMEINQGIGQAPNCYCFPSLVEVFIVKCGYLDLSWLVHAPKLQSLIVWHCNLMEKIIGDGIAREELAASGLFSRLKCLWLDNLPKLRSICDHALLFSQGAEFTICMCAGLKKLPLDSNGMRGSFSIVAGEGWWEEFEWDPAARVTLILKGPVEEMTYGEAARKIKDDESINYLTRMEFLASGEE